MSADHRPIESSVYLRSIELIEVEIMAYVETDSDSGLFAILLSFTNRVIMRHVARILLRGGGH